MARKFQFRGKTLNELKSMDMDKFAKLLKSEARRKISRGLKPSHRKVLKKLQKNGFARTHCRDMIVLPQMIGKEVAIHNGKEFKKIKLKPNHLGHYLGELVQTREKVEHSAPGIGATKASKHIPLK